MDVVTLASVPSAASTAGRLTGAAAGGAFGEASSAGPA